jgi:acetate kinase
MGWNERTYALPHQWYERGVRRYGFHGLSYEYITSELSTYPEINADSRVIIAHLGYGASLCAMRNGKSVVTTMASHRSMEFLWVPRPGSLDPGILSWLIHEALLSPRDIDHLLNYESGLLGLSGESGDMETLLKSKNPASVKAVDYFVHHTHRAIASLAATLGGLDALVFTGGVGENAVKVRERICRQASWLGIALDDGANAKNQIRISQHDSRISVWRIPTNEELVIARHARRLTHPDAVGPAESA